MEAANLFRAIEPVEINFTTSLSLSEAGNKAVSILSQRRGRIKVNDKQIILAGFGSGLKARLLGVLIAGIESAPRDVQVKFDQRDSETGVSILVRDTFGFGSRAGFSGKLQQLMYADALAVRDALSPPGKSQLT